jgi:outer membrane protein OmpA-like peptidoglycan-associated protein
MLGRRIVGMRLQRAPLLGLVVLLLAPCAAVAQPIEGLYIAGAAGANLLMDQPITPSASLGAMGGGDLRYNVGQAFVGGIGYGIGHGVRFELDGDDLMNTLTTRGGAALPSSAKGTTQNYGAMANVLFDLDIGSRYVFPYFGVGLGYQWTGFGDLRVATPSTGASFTGNGTAGGLAGDGIFGLAFPVPGLPGLSITTEYRFLGVIGPEHFGTTLTPAGGAPHPIGTQEVSDNLNQMFLLGVRYAFSVKPPPPPPSATPAATSAPAPAPARSYLVFFDWDKADLTDRAKQIIAEAASASTHVQHTRIEVNGYADRTGTARANQTLSRQRAEAVAAELVRDGVAREAIDIAAFGETHPLVATAAGVREAQNRRVEIVIGAGGGKS